MADEQMKGLVRKHSIFTWDIQNFILGCLTKKSYAAESPLFHLDTFIWFLRLSVKLDGKGMHVYVDFCRCRDSPDEIKMRISVTLNTPMKKIILEEQGKYSSVETNIFNVISYYTTLQEISEGVDNVSYEDTLVISCDMIAVPSYYDHRPGDEKSILSRDLMKLLNEGTETNVDLLVQGKCLRAHKEILSACSPAFLDMFFSGVGRSFFEIPFAEDVVNAMLKYIYSGDIGEVIIDNLLSRELHQCAVKYKIFEIQKLFAPKHMYASNTGNVMKVAVDVNFPLFANSITAFPKQNGATESYTVSEICTAPKNISVGKHVKGRISATLHHENGNVSFGIELSNHDTSGGLQNGAVSVLGTFEILDNNRNSRFWRQLTANFDAEGISKFSFDIEAERLFGDGNILFPYGALKVLCRFKLRLPDETRTPDADLSGPEPTMDNHSFHLVKRMEYLLNSQLFADVILTVPSNESFLMFVHKSILSARSPVLRDLCQKMRRITLDLSTEVVEALMSYIYTGEFCNGYVVYPLYEAAEIYQVSGLKDKCLKLIELQPMTPKSVLKKYEFAAIVKDSRLKQSCKNFIRRNEDIIFGTLRWNDFRERNPSLVEEILTSDDENE